MAELERVERLGNNVLAVFDDGSTITLARMSTHRWVNARGAGGDGPGPGPGTGDFIWPFVPSPTPDGDMPPTGSQDASDAEFGPRDLTGSFHEGMDFGYRNATTGAPIIAMADAIVFHNGPEGAWGNSIILDHGWFGDKYLFTRYAHREAVTGPSEGSSVSQGDVIGTVGSTGQVFGPHLHLETHVTDDGTMVNNNQVVGAFRTAVDPREFMVTYG